MPSPISFNVHAQTGGLDRNAFVDEMVRLQPRVLLIMDEIQLAARCKQSIPECIVIHRKNFSGGRMDNLYGIVGGNVQAVVDHYSPEIDAGLVCYVDNESGFSQQNIDFWQACGERIAERGGRAVVGNLFIGTPEREDLHRADNLIRSALENGYYLGLHEGVYAQEHNKLHWRDGYPFLTGRYSWWLDRMNAIYAGNPPLAPPWVIMTEWTWDGPDIGLRGPAAFAAEWAARGHQPERLMMEQLIDLWEAPAGQIPAYQPGAVAGLCLYCYGQVTPDWGPYDFRQFETLRNYLINYEWNLPFVRDTPPVGEQPPMEPTHVIRLAFAPDTLRFRAGPSTDNSILAALHDGAQIALTGKKTQGPRWLWYEADWNGTVGWFAKVDGVTLSPIAQGDVKHSVRIHITVDEQTVIDETREV